MTDNIEVFKQNSIKIDNIYIDPYGIDKATHDADYIFITHNHYDHYSREDILKIINKDTIFIIPESMKNEYEYDNDVMYVKPNSNYMLDSISFKTFNMYNIDKQYHPKENNWCSYLINYKSIKYLILGDTDDTVDIRNIKTDIVFIPIGGKFTMDINEAIEYLSKIEYKVVIPVHYGSIIGDISLGLMLKDKFSDKCVLKIKE